jgi:hypothetical protein
MFCAYCGSVVESSYRFCAVCGAAVAVDDAVPPFPPSRPRRAGARRALQLGVGAAVLLAIYAAVTYWDSRPTFGPPEAEALELTAAPLVSVGILPSHPSLAGSRFESFDISPEGVVVVAVGPNLFDMASGEFVFANRDAINAFAFVRGALAVVDDRERVGYYDDQGRVSVVGVPPVTGGPGLVASSDRRWVNSVAKSSAESIARTGARESAEAVQRAREARQRQ